MTRTENAIATQGREPRSLCAYCGEGGKLTRDHVISRCLFPCPRPNVMVTVPACEPCNARKALHDDFLRDLLTTDVAGGESPIAQKIFREKTLASVRKGSSLLARIALSQARKISIRTETGLYGGDCAVASFHLDRAIEIFSFLVRGLYFHYRAIVLPRNCKFDARRLNYEGLKKCWKYFENHQYNGPFDLGVGVFRCFNMTAASDEARTFWILVFYDRVFYSVMTTPGGCERQGRG